MGIRELINDFKEWRNLKYLSEKKLVDVTELDSMFKGSKVRLSNMGHGMSIRMVINGVDLFFFDNNAETDENGNVIFKYDGYGVAVQQEE